MSEMNLVVLGGRLVCEPDVRELQDGRPICLMRVACPAARRTPGGSRAPREELDVIVLGAEARRIARHLHPGHGVVVQGSLQMESWEEGEGPEQEGVCVLAHRVCFIVRPPGWPARWVHATWLVWSGMGVLLP